MTPSQPQAPNPNRVAAGRLNRQKRKGLTPEGRERLRQAALANKPWLLTPGPRTPEGKAKAAQNGKLRQRDLKSARTLRAEMRELRGLIEDMRESRRVATGLSLDSG